MKAPNDCGAPRSPNNVTRTSVQYICFRKTSGSNIGAPNLLLAPGAISLRCAPDSNSILLCVVHVQYMKWGVAQLHSYVCHNSLSWSSTFNAFLSHSGKLFANVNICSFLHAALWFNQQGRNEGSRGRNYPGAESLWGLQKTPTMSHVHPSIQYICFRKMSGSKMGAPNLHLASGAI